MCQCAKKVTIVILIVLCLSDAALSVTVSLVKTGIGSEVFFECKLKRQSKEAPFWKINDKLYSLFTLPVGFELNTTGLTDVDVTFNDNQTTFQCLYYQIDNSEILGTLSQLIIPKPEIEIHYLFFNKTKNQLTFYWEIKSKEIAKVTKYRLRVYSISSDAEPEIIHNFQSPPGFLSFTHENFSYSSMVIIEVKACDSNGYCDALNSQRVGINFTNENLIPDSIIRANEGDKLPDLLLANMYPECSKVGSIVALYSNDTVEYNPLTQPITPILELKDDQFYIRENASFILRDNEWILLQESCAVVVGNGSVKLFGEQLLFRFIIEDHVVTRSIVPSLSPSTCERSFYTQEIIIVSTPLLTMILSCLIVIILTVAIFFYKKRFHQERSNDPDIGNEFELPLETEIL